MKNKILFALLVVSIIAVAFLLFIITRSAPSDNPPDSNPPAETYNEENGSSSEALEFLDKYCTRERDEVWFCNIKRGYSAENSQAFARDCEAIGYQFKCEGKCAGGYCYKFLDSNEKCTDSLECESRQCVPSDESCKENCSGTCSDKFPPGPCGGTKKFTYKIIEKGKIIVKTAGGALCD